jgi:hypothetical protein
LKSDRMSLPQPAIYTVKLLRHHPSGSGLHFPDGQRSALMTSQANHGSPTDVRGKLMYAGSFVGRARLDTQTPANNNLVLEPHEMAIRDVRPARGAYNLDEHGFAFVRHKSDAAGDSALSGVSNPRQMLPIGPAARYSTEMLEFVREYTGANMVLPQIGSFIARASKRAKTWTPPAMLVHLDYTTTSASRFVQWTVEACGISTPPHSYFAFIQTWRALSRGPQENSLCVCDGNSVHAEDAVPIDAFTGPADVPGKCFEFRLCKYGEGHSWYYLSNMELEDVVLFKGYDSRYPDAMSAMHSAFKNPLVGAGAGPRRSMEARFLAFFP